MSELRGIARFRFHPGKVMEIVRTREPGTLQYETYFNDDESEAMVWIACHPPHRRSPLTLSP